MRAYSLSKWHPEPEPAETLPQRSPQPEDPPGLLRPREAARLLGMSPSMLLRYRAEADGPVFIRFGPVTVRYRLDDLNDWIAARREQGRLPGRRDYRVRETADMT